MRALIPLFFLAACNPGARFLEDSQGRAIALHGVNIFGSAKWDPLGVAWHTEADYARLRDEWGFNCIRLLVFWDRIAPRQGVVDSTDPAGTWSWQYDSSSQVLEIVSDPGSSDHHILVHP